MKNHYRKIISIFSVERIVIIIYPVATWQINKRQKYVEIGTFSAP